MCDVTLIYIRIFKSARTWLGNPDYSRAGGPKLEVSRQTSLIWTTTPSSKTIHAVWEEVSLMLMQILHRVDAFYLRVSHPHDILRWSISVFNGLQGDRCSQIQRTVT